MAKTTARKTSRKVTKKVTRRAASPVSVSLLSTNGKGFWGKDQPMILLLSSGIILLIVLGLFFSGWL